jgi:hypothetical protein
LVIFCFVILIPFLMLNGPDQLHNRRTLSG